MAPKVLGGIDSKKQKKTLKRVAGVRLRLAHAGSSTALKSDPAAIALVDEYDEMLAGVKKQGDPLGLVEARGFTYGAAFVTGVTSTCSRGVVGTEVDTATGLEFWGMADEDSLESPIWALWQQGTRHHWAWPCPECGVYFIPRFRCMRWPKNASPARARREARMECPHCEAALRDDGDAGVKAGMNKRGVYVAPGQTISPDGRVMGDPPDTTTLSFWVSGLASPFVSWGERVEAYLLALHSGETDKIQTAINAGFGELYSAGGGMFPEVSEVAALKAPYKPNTIPTGVIHLTAGIDVQKASLVYVVRGWGARAKSWLIDAGQLWGSTSEPEVWNDLADFLTEPIGGRLIKRALINSSRPGKRFELPVDPGLRFLPALPADREPLEGRRDPANADHQEQDRGPLGR